MALITTPFGFTSTAAEVLDGVDLSGKRAIVTGATSGIGIETARALAGAGATVTLAVRDPEVGTRVAADIAATTGNHDVRAARLDLVDLASVAAFVAAWTGPLHMLVNNAGIMGLPERALSPAGHELQFATNYLGHYALTTGLHAALVAAQGARVVAVSSNAHRLSPVIFDDIDFDHRPYDPMSAYGQSKTADALLAVEVTRRWSDEGVFANALHPGGIPTNLQKHTGGIKTPLDKRKTPQQGAATSVLVAASPLLEGIGGRYFDNCNEAEVVTEPGMFGSGVSSFALDPDDAARLWELSRRLVAE